MIIAGKTSEIASDSGNWLILDIGFAKKENASCGLLVNSDAPRNLRFSDAVETICTFVTKNKVPVNLVIEAPLSIAFDSTGNPIGRLIEKQGRKARYWYLGLGCQVMVAAIYLVRALAETPHVCEIRLFEGFVSFKEASKKSDHVVDVKILREVIDDPERFSEAIIPPEALKTHKSDVLQSAFLVAGIDGGIPPVIMRNE